jgi:protein N-terminal methyltransferase
VGAGIGRVTSTVLLHLVQDIVLLEPVDNFINAAYAAGLASADAVKPRDRWKGIKEGTKSVTFLQGALQSFDPSHPLSPDIKLIGRVGYTPPSLEEDIDAPLDIAWCQWCLGHLSDADLVSFLKRCKIALREGGRSLIVVKENLCRDFPEESGELCPRTVFDAQDSSLTRYVAVSLILLLIKTYPEISLACRSDLAWKAIFKRAGLTLVKEQIQRGLPEGLYEVKM